MEFPTKKKYFRILSFLLIITTYLPVLTKNLPPVIRSHHLWAVIWVISLVTLVPEIFKNKLLLYVIIYQAIFALFVIADLWTGIDNWTIRSISYDFYYITIAFTLITYYRYSGDYPGLAFIVKWTMIFIGVTAIMSIYSSIIDPLYARKITGGDFEGLDQVFRYGGGTYGYAATLVCLFPLIFYYFRHNSESIFTRTQILIFGFLCFIALYRIQIFANIILAVIVILFSLFGRKDLKRSLFAVTIFLVIFIAIPTNFKTAFIGEVSGIVDQDSENKRKMDDLTEYLNTAGNETMAASRIARYPLLWNAFRVKPFFGHLIEENDSKIGAGAHLYFMYRLTAFGILNFVFFIGIFIKHIKYNMKIFSQGFSFYFLLSALSIIILGLMKNLAGRELWYMYFFIIPGLYYLPVLTHGKSNNSCINDLSVSKNSLC